MILRTAVSIAVAAAALAVWARAAEYNIGLPVYGGPVLGSVFAACGAFMLVAGLQDRLIRWIPHPVLTGFVIACLGVSMIASSAAGLWLVTPVTALACAAFVIGYQRHRPGHHATLHVLPLEEDTRPTTRERILFLLAAVIPWLALYGFTVSMHLPGTAFRFPFEDKLPIYWWTSIFYQSSYVTVGLAPWSARTKRELRQLTISAWVASAVIFPFYWVVPSLAPRRPFEGDNPVANLLHWERNTYPPTAAFPSFHTLWAIFVARLYRPRWLGIAYVTAIAISCITTGMHYIPDVLASFAIAPFLLHPERVWRRLKSAVECVPGSPWAAAVVHILIATAIAGLDNAWKIFAAGVAGGLWAAIFGRWRRLSLFEGALAGTAAVTALFADRWVLLSAHALAAPWTYALARMRPATILVSALLGAILARLWLSGSPAALVCGASAIGLALMRFVEQGYEGERELQWSAVVVFIAGVVLTTVTAPL